MTAFKKKVLALALAGTFALSQTAFVSAATTAATPSQKYLSVIEMGLIKGTSTGAAGTIGTTNGIEKLQRYRAFTLQARLLGYETQMEAFIADEANAGADNFKDVDGKSDYVKGAMAFFKKELKATGYDDGSFKPLDVVSSHEFYKMMLEALGYEYDNDGAGDFTWATVGELAVKAGLVADAKDVNEEDITEAQAGFALYDTLAATVKTPSEGTWAHTLANELVAAKKAPVAYAKPFDKTAPTLTLIEPKGVVIDGTSAKTSKGTDVVTTATVDMPDGMGIEGTSTEPGTVKVVFNGVTQILDVDPVTLHFGDKTKPTPWNYGKSNVVAVTGMDLAGNETYTLTYNLTYSFLGDKAVADSLGGIKVTFNDPVNLASLNSTMAKIYDVNGNTIAVKDVVGVYGDAKSVYVVPTMVLANNSEYKVEVTGIKNTSGSSLGKTFTATGLKVTDVTNPNVVRAQYIDDYKVRLYFSEPIFNSGITSIDQYTVDGNAVTGWVTAGDNRTYVTLHNDYKFSTGTNVIRLKATDDAGNAFGSVVNYVGKDLTAPSIDYVSGSTPYSITVKFNEAIDASKIYNSKATVKYTSDGSVVTATNADIVADDLVVYYFYAPLQQGAHAELTVTNISDMSANVMATATVPFDTTPATAVNTAPVATLTQTSGTKIKVSFDRPVRFIGAFNVSTNSTLLSNIKQCVPWVNIAYSGSNWDATDEVAYSVSEDDKVYRNGSSELVGVRAFTVTFPADKVFDGDTATLKFRNIYDAYAPTNILNNLAGQTVKMNKVVDVTTINDIVYDANSVNSTYKKLYITFNTPVDRNTATNLGNYIVSYPDAYGVMQSYYLSSLPASTRTVTIGRDGKTVIVYSPNFGTTGFPINTTTARMAVQNVKSSTGLVMSPVASRTISAFGTIASNAPAIQDAKLTAANEITVNFTNAVTNLVKTDLRLMVTGTNTNTGNTTTYDLVSTYAGGVTLVIAPDQKSAKYIFNTPNATVVDANGVVELPNGSKPNINTAYVILSPNSTACDSYDRALTTGLLASYPITNLSNPLVKTGDVAVANKDDISSYANDYVSFSVPFNKTLKGSTVTATNIGLDLDVTALNGTAYSAPLAMVGNVYKEATMDNAILAAKALANGQFVVYNAVDTDTLTFLFKAPTSSADTVKAGTTLVLSKKPNYNATTAITDLQGNLLSSFASVRAVVPAAAQYTSTVVSTPSTVVPAFVVAPVYTSGAAAGQIKANIATTATIATFGFLVGPQISNITAGGTLAAAGGAVYTSGTSVTATVGQYLTIYGVDAAGIVVAYDSHLVVAADLAAMAASPVSVSFSQSITSGMSILVPSYTAADMYTATANITGANDASTSFGALGNPCKFSFNLGLAANTTATISMTTSSGLATTSVAGVAVTATTASPFVYTSGTEIQVGATGTLEFAVTIKETGKVDRTFTVTITIG